jgi:eukaryotic-like serine/threonine-protein kinase
VARKRCSYELEYDPLSTLRERECRCFERTPREEDKAYASSKQEQLEVPLPRDDAPNDHPGSLPLKPSDILDQRYRLERPLGSGGMAEVWLAEDERLGRWVAVKILAESIQATEDGGLAESIQREARTIASLQHPNIVGIFDAGKVEGRSYLVMEYVHGYTLRELLDSAGRVSEAEAVKYGEQVAAALHFAHEQGVVHCDVKPENILINEKGVAKVADFGVAEPITKTLTPEQAREVLGTVAYLAPEVLQGQPSTPASDVYSLGLTIYEMVAGRLPFTGATSALVAAQRLASPAPPLSSVLPGASQALESTLARALATQPAQRFTTAESFRQSLLQAGQALEHTTQRVPVMAPPAAAPPPPPRRPGRSGRTAYGDEPRSSGSNVALIVAAVGVVVLAIGVGAIVAALIVGQNGAAPVPTPTPTPTEAPTLEPTPAEQSPTPTPTPEPTLTPTEEPTEEPTETPTPTQEAETPTPEFTPTPDLEGTPTVEGASFPPGRTRGRGGQ